MTLQQLAERAIAEGWPVVASATMAVPQKIAMSYTDGGRARAYSIPIYYEPLCETRWYEIPHHLHAQLDVNDIA